MFEHHRSFSLLLIGSTLLLTACGTPDGGFPSLERRPYETEKPVEEPVGAVPVPSISLPADLAAKVDALVRQHKAANAAFGAGLPSMQNIAAKASGSAPGNENWVNAHLMLSRLDKTRADSVAALGAFDGLISEQADGDSVYIVLLSGYQQDIADDVAAQTTQIDRMSRQIGE